MNPDDATEADLKVAYAKLLRQHRPDQDPEGFERLRAAFEAARAELSGRGGCVPEGDWEVGSVGSDSPQSGQAAGIHAALRSAIHRLPPSQQAQPNEFQTEFRRMREFFFEKFAAAQKRPGDLAEFTAAAARLLADKPALLEALVSPEMLVSEIVAGAGSLAVPTLLSWEEHRRKDRLEAFDRALKSQSVAVHRGAGAVALAGVAAEVGFFLPRLARAVADDLFPVLPAAQRGEIMHRLETAMSLGKIFEMFPHEQKRFWWRRVHEADAPFDWESAEAVEARDELLRHPARNWNGWEVIRTLAPEGWLEKRSTPPVSRRTDLTVRQPEDEEFWDLEETASLAVGLGSADASGQPVPKAVPAAASPKSAPDLVGSRSRRATRHGSLPAKSVSEGERLATMGRRRGKPRRSPIGRLFGRRSLRGTLPGLSILILAVVILFFLFYALLSRG